MTVQNHQACVWATRRDMWDSFLNDPELAKAIETARSAESADSVADSPDTAEQKSEPVENDAEKQQPICLRLLAYETPITDEILRQSIR